MELVKFTNGICFELNLKEKKKKNLTEINAEKIGVYLHFLSSLLLFV